MFRKLHLQLTSLCIVITGLALTVLSCICLYFSESGVRSQAHTSFLAALDSMYQNLAQQTSLSHRWIRQMEHNHQFYLRISDNGSPLFFQELEEAPIPQKLWSTAEEKARADYGIDLKNPGTLSVLTRYEEFPLVCDGEHYNASVCLIPRGNGYIGVTVLQPLAQMESRIFRQRLVFLLASLTALMLLGIFFWHFTGRMLRPLIENRKKQMQFVASASHELRSPLTVILSNTAAVRNGAMEGDSHFLDVIDSEGKRMSRLITDMLQLAGADNHSWSIHPEEVEIDTLLLQTWEHFEPVAVSHGLRWEISLPEVPVPRCICDEERIRQLLSILIENAFSYTPSGGLVKLTLYVLPQSGNSTTHTSSTGNPPLFVRGSDPSAASQGRNRIFPLLSHRSTRHDRLYISVSDNGPGISDNQKEAIFERFQRLDRSRTDKSHFGLGLCIAQEIAHLHHSQIVVADTPGGGTTFTVTLPLSISDRTAG